MNDAQKQKLSALKTANRQYARQQQWQRNVLLQECLQRIGTYRIVDDETLLAAILEIASSPRLICGTMPVIDPTHTCAIVWDEEQLPVIICGAEAIARNWEDIAAVAFDTCLVDLTRRQAFLIRT